MLAFPRGAHSFTLPNREDSGSFGAVGYGRCDFWIRTGVNGTRTGAAAGHASACCAGTAVPGAAGFGGARVGCYAESFASSHGDCFAPIDTERSNRAMATPGSQCGDVCELRTGDG